jgi:hypothetical protein
VEGFSKAEQLHRIAQCRDDLVDGGVEGLGRIDRERNRFVLNPIVESGIHGIGTMHRIGT